MIVITDTLWELLLDCLTEHSENLERVAYFDGILVEGIGVATTLTLPNAISRPQNFQVSSSSMSAAGQHLRAMRMRRLAQVHTHPADWTGHSMYDDERAYSQRAGALSIVLPGYARERPRLAGAGVHLREEQGWRELSPDEVQSYVRLVPGLIDLRDEAL
jgi:hypothetical protein